jgi:hypothetical protein
MTMRRLFATGLAVLALAAGATLASADDKKDEKKTGLGGELEQYFKIHGSLAGDKLDGVKASAELLAKSTDKGTVKAAEALGKAKEIAEARKAFGDLSKVLIERVEAAAKAGEKLAPVFVFECPMAKPYGKWMQSTKEIANPYYGSEMPNCGKLVATKGEAKCGCCDGEEDKKDAKKAEKESDHKEHDHKEHDHDHK